MKAIHLTNTIVNNAVYQGKNRGFYALWDDFPKGFGLRIHPSGKKQFIVSYRHEGRKRFYTIGDYPDITVDKARGIAKGILLKVSQGLDPAKEKIESRRGETLEDLFREYKERHLIPNCKPLTQDHTTRRMEIHVLPTLGKKRIKDITPKEIENLHRKISADHPVMANRVIDHLHAIFNQAFEWEWLPSDHRNPCRGIKRNRERPRDNWCKPEQIPALLDAIRSCPSIVFRSYFQFLLYTGLRRTEAATIQWSFVDLKRRELRLPETKNGRVHVLPLNELALGILEQMPRQEGNPFVFWSDSPSGHIESPKQAWQKVREAAGLPDLTLHDLRRTHGSILAINQIPLHVIGKILNHADGSSTKIYAQLSETYLSEVENIFADKIISFSTIKGQKKKAAS